MALLDRGFHQIGRGGVGHRQRRARPDTIRTLGPSGGIARPATAELRRRIARRARLEPPVRVARHVLIIRRLASCFPPVIARDNRRRRPTCYWICFRRFRPKTAPLAHAILPNDKAALFTQRGIVAEITMRLWLY
jgi:hypothetical protein